MPSFAYGAHRKLPSDTCRRYGKEHTIHHAFQETKFFDSGARIAETL
jgi:hypothetical protein